MSLASLYSDVLIRPAKSDDALEVARVHVRSWQAAYRGLLPGFATIAAASGADAISCAELSALYVDPDHFRRGVGSGLLRAACNRLKEQGIREVVP